MADVYIAFCKQDGLPEEYWELLEKDIKGTARYQRHLLSIAVNELKDAIFNELDKHLHISKFLKKVLMLDQR